jgi:squalene-hopene/tetraprenyl-beta-curcumene cyclase
VIGKGNFIESIHRATRWIVGMQDGNGGYGAFDVDNTYYYLNEIPFADHGALLDPPTADVSARCLMLMAKVAQDHDEYLPTSVMVTLVVFAPTAIVMLYAF